MMDGYGRRGGEGEREDQEGRGRRRVCEIGDTRKEASEWMTIVDEAIERNAVNPIWTFPC
jgi:hypothetical protein